MSVPGTSMRWTHERLALYITARASDVNDDPPRLRASYNSFARHSRRSGSTSTGEIDEHYLGQVPVETT